MPIVLPIGEPCYFCQLMTNTADHWQVIEDAQLTVTVLNVRQLEVGQCVVATRRHAPTVFELLPAEQAAVMAAAQRVALAMRTAFDPDGILLYQNNGVGSRQEVPHFHLHVVPRRAGSDWGTGPSHLAKLEAAGIPEQADYRVVTELKRNTAADLRLNLPRA